MPVNSFQPGEIVFVWFPFSSGGQGKERPALVLLDSGDADLLVARLTRNRPPAAFELPIVHWQAANLYGPALARLHKLATVSKKTIKQRIGTLHPADRQSIAALLNQMFGNW